MKDTPRKWRIRRTWSGKWAVLIRLPNPLDRATSYIYAPLATWDTWGDALAYIQRAHTHNYGKGAAA